MKPQLSLQIHFGRVFFGLVFPVTSNGVLADSHKAYFGRLSSILCLGHMWGDSQGSLRRTPDPLWPALCLVSRSSWAAACEYWSTDSIHFGNPLWFQFLGHMQGDSWGTKRAPIMSGFLFSLRRLVESVHSADRRFSVYTCIYIYINTHIWSSIYI